MKNIIRKLFTQATCALLLVSSFANISAQAYTLTPVSSNSQEKVKIVDFDVDNRSFNPYDDQEVEITFELNKGAYVTVEIFEEDEDDDEIFTIEDEEYFSAGKHTVEWDGRDEYDDIVSQGKYEFKITAKADGEKDVEKGALKVDKNVEDRNDTVDPRIKRNYATKDEFDPGRHEKTYIVFELTSEADLTVEIYDKSGDLIEELLDEDNADASVYRILWDGDGVEDDEGTYTYKIKAKNSKGEDSASGDIEVKDDKKDSNKPNIYKDSMEQLRISFTLEKEGEVTIEFRDDSETIKTLIDEKELGAGAYTFNWDGRDEYGTYLSDGVYKYKITAGNFKGKDVEWGYFSVTGSTKANNLESCGGFVDVDKKSSKCDAIKWAKNNDIFIGYSGGEFRPNQAITRVEALKVIFEALEIRVLESDGILRNFPDLEAGAWYAKYIKTALSLGIVNGYPNGLFKPNQAVNRVEALVMLLNTGKVRDNLIVPTNNYGQPYYDTPNSKNTQWYMSYVWVAKEHSLTSSNAYFYPDAQMTRADMADMLYRYYIAGLKN